MITLADLTPGTIGFARHVRPLAADLLILAGQTMLGEPGYPHHVIVVTKAGSMTLANRPSIVQAMPSGAEEITIGAEFWTKDYTYIRPQYVTAPRLQYDGQAVAHAAHNYVGTPYSFADYAAIAGVHFGITNGPIRRYVTSSKHMICSQLADQAMSDAGWHIFDDGRLPQDVTPAALHAQMRKMPGQWIIPGMADWVDNLSPEWK